MSRENVETVRAAHEAYTRRDINGFLTLMHPDVEFRSLIVEADAAGAYHGREGVRRWYETVASTFENPGSELHDAWDLGDDRVLAKIATWGTVDGVKVAQTMWQAVVLREGRVASTAFCRTEAEALEAVGLRE